MGDGNAQIAAIAKRCGERVEFDPLLPFEVGL